MENLEVPSIAESFNYLSFAQNWIYEHIFELIILLALIAVAIYHYTKDKKLYLSNWFKSFMESAEEKANQTFGKLWLKANMDGNSIRTKSVTFNDEDEYENDQSIGSSYI